MGWFSSGLRQPAEAFELEVKFPANPGIGCGVGELFGGKFRGGPIGGLGALGDAAVEEEAGEVPDPSLFQSILLGDVAEVQNIGRLEGEQLLQVGKVPADRDPSLADVRVFKNRGQDCDAIEAVQLKEIDGGGGADLDETGRMGGAFAEGGAGFGIKADYALLVDGGRGRGQIGLRGTEVEGPLIPEDWQLH